MRKRQLFIIGVPRSGTTLTRQLLISHPDIVMPDEEFQLIPYFLNKYKNRCLTEYELREYVSVIENSPFFYHMKKSFDLISSEYIKENSENLSIANVILTTLVYFANVKNEKFADISYVGDKTPNNLLHLPLLIKFFPDAKFIHVVRDPRDVYLSMRKAWGKSLKRAALQWSGGIDAADRFFLEHPESLITVKYEDLLQATKETLTRICEFLSIPFYDDLVNLKKNKERIGDSTGVDGIFKSNVDKFKEQMHPKEQQMMLELIGRRLVRYGYAKDAPDKTKVPGKFELALLAGVDFISGFSWHIKDKGFVNGIMYRIRQFTLR